MGQTMYVFGLFFITSIISSFAAELSNYKNIKKSSLILEYNWPEPSKSLNRLPHPRSCHHFIHTKHDGSHVIKRCHGDKIFDYRSLRCQHKSSAKCWKDIVKKGIEKKIKKAFSCPFPWGLYPDKEDCTVFYNCMGGKVYPRKCPDSTLFDVVERICVHSKKALCARDSDIPNPSDSISELANEVSTTIPSKSSGTFDTDSKERNSEEVDKKSRKKSKNKLVTSKFSFISSSTNPKSFRTADSEEDSSEEKNSSEEKHRTKPKNKFITSKLSLLSTSTVNPKLFKKTKSDFQENSSEEEENSSEEKGKIRQKLKFTTSKIQTPSNIKHKKGNSEIIPISTNMFTEKEHITSSSKDGHSSESPFQSTAVKPLVSTENKLKPLVNTITPEVSDKDVGGNDNTENVLWSTETVPKEFISSAITRDNLKLVLLTTVPPEVEKKGDDKNDNINPVSRHTEITSMEHISSVDASSPEKIDTTSKILFTSDSSAIHSITTENSKIESTSEGSFSFSCPEPDGHFPHPTNANLFVVCSGNNPIIMKCPEGLVFDSHSTSCNYAMIF